MFKIIKKITQLLINVLICIITIVILFLLYRIFSMKVLNKEYFDFFGFSAFQIATGSMEPALKVKDVIIVKKADEFNVNDIITYKDGKDMITHRIISIDDGVITTKGDANNSLDTKIDIDSIIGKCVFTIPKGGLIRDMFLTPKIVICIIAIMIIYNIYINSAAKEKIDKLINEKRRKINDRYSLENTISIQLIKKEVKYEDNEDKVENVEMLNQGEDIEII